MELSKKAAFLKKATRRETSARLAAIYLPFSFLSLSISRFSTLPLYNCCLFLGFSVFGELLSTMPALLSFASELPADEGSVVVILGNVDDVRSSLAAVPPSPLLAQVMESEESRVSVPRNEKERRVRGRRIKRDGRGSEATRSEMRGEEMEP